MQRSARSNDLCGGNERAPDRDVTVGTDVIKVLIPSLLMRSPQPAFPRGDDVVATPAWMRVRVNPEERSGRCFRFTHPGGASTPVYIAADNQAGLRASPEAERAEVVSMARLPRLGNLSGRLLKGSKRNSAPLCQQSQMRISAQRPLMAKLA